MKEPTTTWTNLIESGTHEIETGDDGSIRAEAVRSHHLLVVHCVTNVYVGWKRHLNVEDNASEFSFI